MTVTYPLRLFFDCSTAHLTRETRNWLDERAVDAAAHRSARIDAPSATPFGWFLWAERAPGAEVPLDLGATGPQQAKFLLIKGHFRLPGVPTRRPAHEEPGLGCELQR